MPRVISTVVAHERGRVASLSRSRTPDDWELVTARRNLKAELLAERICEALGSEPSLTSAQRARLAALLLP